ncbi:hypothetical protein [Parvicella tangerina]|uniref:Uncharacterized protein n=1 Tax=Parvicella tangerina TaxID=2829795 RepID=A0A916JNX9_9FLAO|nr:hypothetical protein [Parvicella tangerina]CAG5081788.1 hypothetical protein CRYO30217_01728 [Parvicella tangerina]
MDKHLYDNEIRLQELLEQKQFEELSADEKSFVLTLLTKEEYQLQRNIIIESATLYADKQNAIAPPLVPINECKGFWFKSLPLYQSGIAVAAVVLITWFIKPLEKEVIKTEAQTEYITKVDTLIKTEYVYDTVYEVIEKPLVVEKITYVEVPVESNTPSNEYADSKRVLNPSGPYPVSTMGIDKHSTSSSFANDETAVLIPNIILKD